MPAFALPGSCCYQSMNKPWGSGSSSKTASESDISQKTINCDDNDYGFFMKGIEYENEMQFPKEHFYASSTHKNFKVVFTFNIKSAPIFCRSFISVEGLSNNIQVSCSVTGIRIIQDASGEHAEFKIMISNGNLAYTAWREHSDFHDLIQAVTLFSHGKSCLEKSLIIWKEISRRRLWRFQLLSVKYLTWKAIKLGEFLREFLFEITTPSILVAFVKDE
eukprot:gene9572-19887_t